MSDLVEKIKRKSLTWYQEMRVEGCIGIWRGRGVRETNRRRGGDRRESKERDGINDKYLWSKITCK